MRNEAGKPESLKSLQAILRETQLLAAAQAKDYAETIDARDAEIKRLRLALESAGKYFEYLRTHLSLIRQNAEQAEHTAAHFAGAYAADVLKRV